MDVDTEDITAPTSERRVRPRCIEISAGQVCMFRAISWPSRVRLETVLGLAIDMEPCNDAADILTTVVRGRTSRSVVDFSAEKLFMILVHSKASLYFNCCCASLAAEQQPVTAPRSLVLELHDGSVVHALPALRAQLHVNYSGSVTLSGCNVHRPQFTSVRLCKIAGAPPSALNFSLIDTSARTSGSGSNISTVSPAHAGLSGGELLLHLEARLAVLARYINKLAAIKGYVREQNTLDQLTGTDTCCVQLLEAIRETQDDATNALIYSKIETARTKIDMSIQLLADDVAATALTKGYCSVCIESAADVMRICHTCNTSVCEKCLDDLVLNDMVTCLTCKKPMKCLRTMLVNI